GYRSDGAALVFYGLKIVATLVMLFVALLMQNKLPDNPVMRVVLLISGAGAGWVLPGFFLEKKVKKRQEILRLSLPDGLDLRGVVARVARRTRQSGGWRGGRLCGATRGGYRTCAASWQLQTQCWEGK